MADQQLTIVLKATDKGLVGVVKGASSELKQLEKSARASGSGVDQMFSGLTKSIGSYIGAFATLKTVISGISAADQFQQLQARVELATEGLGRADVAWKRLGDIAQSTGASLEATVSVFQNLTNSAHELGATQGDLLKLTDIVEKLGVISGASTAQMNNGLLQFGQAMASGVVHAEEFNSILENIPALAKAIADGLGYSVGQLRIMVKEGKIASTEAFGALLKQSSEIETKFQAMPRTIGQAFSGLGTAVGRLLADIDTSVGFTDALAKILDSASGAANSLAGYTQDVASATGQASASAKRCA